MRTHTSRTPALRLAQGVLIAAREAGLLSRGGPDAAWVAPWGGRGWDTPWADAGALLRVHSLALYRLRGRPVTLLSKSVTVH